MKKMKDLPSTVFMIIGFILGVIAVLLMFAPAVLIVNKMNNDGQLVFNAPALFWNEALEGARSTVVNMPNGVPASFAGYMLILVGALAMGVMAIPAVQPSAKVEKIILGLAALFLLTGIILIFTIGIQLVAVNPDLAKFDWQVYINGGTIAAGVFAILALGADVFAMYLDW